MNKMKTPEAEVVRFDAEDILTTSCTSFSAYSTHYKVTHVSDDEIVCEAYKWNGASKNWEETRSYSGYIHNGVGIFMETDEEGNDIYFSLDPGEQRTLVEGALFLQPHMSNSIVWDDHEHLFPFSN